MFEGQYASGAGFDSSLCSFGGSDYAPYFDGTGLIILCSCLRFRVWVWFH